MLKILIVDDELPFREMLEATVDWDAYDIKISGFAENGKDAIEYILREQPDIVLTDLKMLIMDGIQLSKWVYENYPWIKVIILSAYCEFEYAQKAMRYGVVNYISKPLDLEILFETIEKIREEIARSKKKLSEYESIKTALSMNIPFMRERLIVDLLKGRYSGSAEEFLEKYDISIKGDSFIVSLVLIENAGKGTRSTSLVKESDDDLIQEINNWFEKTSDHKLNVFFFKDEASFIGMIISDKKTDSDYFYIKVLDSLTDLKGYLLENDLILSAGISNAKHGLENLNICYQEACMAIKARFLLGTGTIISYRYLERKKADIMDCTDEIDKIFESMKNYDWMSTRLGINNYFNHLISGTDILEIGAQIIVYELLSILKRLHYYDRNLPKLNISHDEIQKMIDIKTIDGVQRAIVQKFYNFYESMKELRDNNSNKILDQARMYIEGNYMHEITLSGLSKQIFISSSHLSRLFMKILGITFLEYLTQYRIEKAKELLLKSDLKVYEVSHLVGYKSEKHFIRMFKKSTGLPPLKFKSKRVNNNH